jgi:hypothetical protein
MQEDRATPATDSRGGVVVDLDDEIVEMILARQPIASLVLVETNGLVVVTVLRVLAPGVFGTDRARRQQGLGPLMAVRPPPQTERVEDAPGRAAVAFALVGKDAAAAKCHWHGQVASAQPTPAGVAGSGTNTYRGKGAVTHGCHISD